MKTIRITCLTILLLATAAAAGAEEWRFDATPGGRLEIDLETGGTVEVRGSGTGAVDVEAELEGRAADWAKVTAEKTAKGVRVRAEATRRSRGGSGSVNLVVTVPTRFDVEVSTMGGEVSIEGVEGTFSGDSMGGGLVLHRLRGHAALSTQGGSIEVSESTLDGSVETMGGNVTFRNVRGGLRGKTMGGRVTVDDSDATALSEDGRVVEIDTMGGNVEVERAPRGARVHTMGGNVRVASAREFVEATTMGGDVRILEVDGRVEASTMSGDVEVRVVGEGGEIEIESMSGDLELTLPASFSGAFDVEVAYTRDSRGDFEIRSDFPLTESRSTEWEYGREGNKRFHSDRGDLPRKYIRGKGTNAGGKHRVLLSTVNGDIVIRRAG